MSAARVKWTKNHEVRHKMGNGWILCLQWVKYCYDDGGSEDGYQFIYRRPNTENLQAARGQARIPSLKIARRLMNMAAKKGWGGKHA